MKHSATLAILLAISTLPTAVLAATEAECAVLKRANPEVYCDENTPIFPVDRALGINKQVAEAKDFLLKNARDLRNSKAPPTCPANIYRLNNTFSVCLSRFIRAANSVYGDGAVTVVSAFRSPDPNDPCGNNAAAGGAPNSNHQYGRAADVAPGRGLSYEDLQDFAKANPQFGVCFPYVPRLTNSGSFYDAPHMALAGTGTGEARLCAIQGVTNYCDNSPTFDPNDINIPGRTPQTNNTSATERYKSLLSSLFGRNNSSAPGSFGYTNPFSVFSPSTQSYPTYSTPSSTPTYSEDEYGYESAYDDPVYNPPLYDNPYPNTKTEYQKLVEENPNEYIYNAPGSTLPAELPTTSQHLLVPANSFIPNPSNTDRATYNMPLYTPGGDPQYMPATLPQTSESRASQKTPGFIETLLGGRDNSTNLPDSILYDDMSSEQTGTPLQEFDPNNKPAEWVDGSFYQDSGQRKSWWGKFISFFGF